MKAVVVSPGRPGALSIGERPEPRQDSDQTLVRVHAVSLNRGEVNRAQSMEAGAGIGWDFAGTVDRPAPNGSGPPAGQPVVGFSPAMEGWAERVAIDWRSLAVVPGTIRLEDACTLPVAGLTALYGLERCNRLLADKVLVTGASGGVGWYACQLARLMGARVVAQVRRDDQVALVQRTGAESVIVDTDGSRLAGYGPYRLVLDGVGGPQLGRLLSMLAPDGQAVLYGVSAGRTTGLQIRDLMGTGSGRVNGFHLYRESEIVSAGRGLERLLYLLESGSLATLVERTEPWENVGEVAAALLERAYAGKAVLTVTR